MTHCFLVTSVAAAEQQSRRVPRCALQFTHSMQLMHNEQQQLLAIKTEGGGLTLSIAIAIQLLSQQVIVLSTAHPSRRMRSRTSTRCGEVNIPVL